MKRIMLAAGLMMVSAMCANAQQTAPSAPSVQPVAPGVTKVEKAPAREAVGSWAVRDFVNSAVYNSAGDRVGDINDIIVDESGNVTAFVVGVGGFLGIGEKEVELTPDKFKRMVHSDGKIHFTVNATSDDLAVAPKYERPRS